MNSFKKKVLAAALAMSAGASAGTGGGISVVVSQVGYTLKDNVNVVLAETDGTCNSTLTPCTFTGTVRDNLLTSNNNPGSISALGGHDIIDGLGGNDTLSGGDGNDTIGGGNHADTIYGDAGADNLQGQAGNDTVVCGAGSDTVGLNGTGYGSGTRYPSGGYYSFTNGTETDTVASDCEVVIHGSSRWNCTASSCVYVP